MKNNKKDQLHGFSPRKKISRKALENTIKKDVTSNIYENFIFI